MTNRIRTLTVSRLYREWGEPHRKRECVAPSVRLNCKWLASLGIVPGQKIRVVTNGHLSHSRQSALRMSFVIMANEVTEMSIETWSFWNLNNMECLTRAALAHVFGRTPVTSNFLLNRRLALTSCSEQRVELRRD
jgi:hypothetical protein